MLYIFPIALRYLSMVLQFVTLILISRRLTPTEVGTYYEAFGLVTTTYVLAGIGLPDGLIKAVAEAIACGDRGCVRALIRRAGLYAQVITLLLAVAGAAVFLLRFPRSVVLYTAGWWLAYGLLFFYSQALVALSETSWAAFFFYPATSIGAFTVTVPYLLISRHPDIKGTLMATMFATAACAIASYVCMKYKLGDLPAEHEDRSLKPVFRLGIWICTSRVLQNSLYSIPVWGIGLSLGAAAAASIGTASRLNLALGAVMAAIRFTVRPQIVHDASRGDWASIARRSGKAASYATYGTVLAIVGVLIFGRWGIGLVFGPTYRAAAPLLAIMLFGTLGECIGGPVDEILKMTGRANAVTGTLFIACIAEGALVLGLSRFGPVGVAVVQAAIFLVIYLCLLSLVWRRNGVYVGASPTIFPRLLAGQVD